MTQPIYTIIYYLSLFYTLLYIVIMCNYAINYFITIEKEKFWENATNDDVLKKVFKIASKYDKTMSLTDIDDLLQKILKLKEYHIEFKIECYREGVKKRLKEILELESTKMK